MAISTAITFHRSDRSDAIEAAIHRWVARLEHVGVTMLRCEVRVEQPSRFSRQPWVEIHVVLAVAGATLAASSTRSEDVYVAIADAFRATRRQLLAAVDARRERSTGPLSLVTSS